MRHSIVCVAAVALGVAASSTYAAWRVDSSQSTLSFVTAKAGAPGVGGIEEVQAFKQVGGSVDAHRFDALRVGASTDVELMGQLTIAGQTRPLTASLRVVKLASNALLVGTREPVVVNLKDYGLQDGLEALRTVMNLNVLASSAPVSFSVVLRSGN